MAIELFHLHSNANELPYSQTTYWKMATTLTPKLSKYAEELTISDKRRYLENIEGGGDPYLYESHTLQADFLPPVRFTDISWPQQPIMLSTIVFARGSDLRHTRAWTFISILQVLSAK